MTEATPQNQQTTPARQNRKNMVNGIIALAAIILIIGAWVVLNDRSPAANQQLEAFVAAAPELVAIGGGSAPVITSDDVTLPFFVLNDMASPAEIRMATAPLFDRVTPAAVWIFAEKNWADETPAADLGLLIDDLKSRMVDVTLILPPQEGETADTAVNAFAALSNDKSITFLDYHDAAKLGTPLCPLPPTNDETASANSTETYVTQQMLLQMAINAPATRAQLRLADIGARIETLKAEANCPGATVPDMAGDAETTMETEASLEETTPAE